MRKLLFALATTLVCLTTTAQVPADSVGIFAVYDNQITRMDRITHIAIKGSGGLASAVTFGVAKIKAKLQFKGATSQNQFHDTAKFRMYFGMPPLERMANLFMFSPNYSAKNFGTARFEVKKDYRFLTGVSTSILGSSMGVSSADDLQITTTEIRPGVYDIIVKGQPGEYCFMLMAYGAGGFGGVYDFTIK